MLSNGEKLLREYVLLLFPGEEALYNYRPGWLYGMELDVFLPRLSLAFEFNGDQHYVDTDFGPCAPQVKRDRNKRHLCRERGVGLVIVEAIDLEYTKLRSKIKAKAKRDTLPCMTKQSVKGLRKLNKQAIEYRKTLIQKYDSPTARRKKGQPRKDAFAARKPQADLEAQAAL